jgi:peptide/nickel transport system substrate-binding protein
LSVDAERGSIHSNVRIVAMLGAAVAALTLSLGATSGGRSAGGKEGGTFRTSISTVAGFGSIDPTLYTNEAPALRPACAALMSYPNKPLPAGLRLTPELAESYPVVSRDRRTYTFRVRSDARFSNGARVTARDLVHSLERILDPNMKSAYSPDFKDLVGAQKMLAGNATSLPGAFAQGRMLRLRLTRALPDFLARTSVLCVVPAAIPADPEGAKAPLPSPAPYYVSEYVPGERFVLERNMFYRGSRPHHVDRITADLTGDASAVDDVAGGKLDFVHPTPDLSPQLLRLVKRYGANRSRLFLQPGAVTRMFLINTSRPLFRNNVELRRAVNFAVDRRALVREFGPYAASATDQYLPRGMPGFRDKRIYPLRGPDLRRARALAKGRTRSGRAVLYTCSDRPDCIALAQVLQQNLAAIGFELRIKQFPLQLMFQKLANPREPFDLAWVGFGAAWTDPQTFLGIFDGRTIGRPDNVNWSYFDSPRYSRLLERASRLTGPARYRAYGELDVELAREAAPAIAVVSPNSWAFVSARTGCVVMNPGFDLTADCLK